MPRGCFCTNQSPLAMAGRPADWSAAAGGTASTPFSSPTGWTTSGASQSYASWGNDGTPAQGLKSSDALPDGNARVIEGDHLTAVGNPALADTIVEFLGADVAIPRAHEIGLAFLPRCHPTARITAMIVALYTRCSSS